MSAVRRHEFIYIRRKPRTSIELLLSSGCEENIGIPDVLILCTPSSRPYMHEYATEDIVQTLEFQ